MAKCRAKVYKVYKGAKRQINPQVLESRMLYSRTTVPSLRSKSFPQKSHLSIILTGNQIPTTLCFDNQHVKDSISLSNASHISHQYHKNCCSKKLETNEKIFV
uniref:Uncharacterized protein n=1 Tax=Romanomermis culicivorax TaxID=13658 RepID=A0A915HPG5_ROMCU